MIKFRMHELKGWNKRAQAASLRFRVLHTKLLPTVETFRLCIFTTPFLLVEYHRGGLVCQCSNIRALHAAFEAIVS